MIVVSDTSAITSLIQIGREELFPQLFSRALIPNAVSNELLKFHQILTEFLEVAAVRDQVLVRELCEKIDSGEAEAIVLAHELSADFVLIDDLEARAIAIHRGLPVHWFGRNPCGSKTNELGSISETGPLRIGRHCRI